MKSVRYSILISSLLLSASLLFLSCTRKVKGFTGVITRENIHAGFIYSGEKEEDVFTQAFEKARINLEKDGIKTSYIENISETSDCDRALNILLEKGCNVIYATRYGFSDTVFKYAEKYPDVRFSCFASEKTSKNVSSFSAKIYEARYLTGMAAGAKSSTGKIGYIASIPIPEVIRGLNAFTLGARKMNPEAIVEVIWTDTWYDPYLDEKAAKILIDKGCDVLSWHQNSAEAQKVAAENNVYSTGFISSTRDIAPDYYLTAAIYNWESYIKDDVKKILEGSWTERNYWGSMAEGAVDIDGLYNIDSVAMLDINDAKKDIISGKLKIFQGPVFGQEYNLAIEEGKNLSDMELLTMKWYTRGILGILK